MMILNATDKNVMNVKIAPENVVTRAFVTRIRLFKLHYIVITSSFLF